jgi:hypothetical protein
MAPRPTWIAAAIHVDRVRTEASAASVRIVPRGAARPRWIAPGRVGDLWAVAARNLRDPEARVAVRAKAVQRVSRGRQRAEERSPASAARPQSSIALTGPASAPKTATVRLLAQTRPMPVRMSANRTAIAHSIARQSPARALVSVRFARTPVPVPAKITVAARSATALAGVGVHVPVLPRDAAPAAAAAVSSLASMVPHAACNASVVAFRCARIPRARIDVMVAAA